MSTEIVPFDDNAPAIQNGGSMLAMATSRAAQEVQAAMVIAKKFPRDTNGAYTRIINACKRPSLATVSQYSYPRGDTTVTGPTIRLAEALAQNWGNLDFGIIELEQKDEESIVMSYAWDLETNTRQVKVFTVPHIRDSKRGGKQKLTDQRDIYEMVANQGARRLRACILGVIPGDIVDAALDQCEATLRDKDKNIPLEDRVRSMLVAFDQIGVNQAMIEKKFKHKVSVISETEFVQLRKIYNALKDGMGKREDHFDMEPEVAAPVFEQPKQRKPRTAPAKPEPEVTGTDNGKPIYEKQPVDPDWPDVEQPVDVVGTGEIKPVKLATQVRNLCKASGVEELDVLGWMAEKNIGRHSTFDLCTDEELKQVVAQIQTVVDDILGQ